MHKEFVRHDWDHSLSHAAEECAEFLCAYSKANRWGLYSVNPLLPENEREANIWWIHREMKDAIEALERLQRCFDDYEYPEEE